MINIQKHARWIAAGVAGAVLLAACNVKQELLAPQQPGTLVPGDVSAAGAAGAEALRVGAISAVNQLVGGGNGNQENLWMMADLLTDVWKSSDTFLQRNETDQRRIQTTNAVWTSAYLMAHRVRGYARDAATALATSQPTQPGEQAEMWFFMGFAEMNLAEDFCNGIPYSFTVNGVPDYKAPITDAAGFALAITHFDSALALANGTDSVAARAKNETLIAKARTLVDLGQFDQAAALLAAVPTSFVYQQTFSQTTTSNEIWTLNASQSSARYAVGDSFDYAGPIANALPFATANDPRVPVAGGNSNNVKATGIDKSTPWVAAFWKTRADPIIVVSGLDARLIEAEDKLQNADYAGMTTILNALRAAPPSLGPIKPAAMAALAVPATKDAAINLYFREKAFWQFGRGQRLSDLRRLVRQYGRTQDQVFPNGQFFKGGTYSTDVNAPVPDAEKSNPLFAGCIDRNA